MRGGGGGGGGEGGRTETKTEIDSIPKLHCLSKSLMNERKKTRNSAKPKC